MGYGLGDITLDALAVHVGITQNIMSLGFARRRTSFQSTDIDLGEG